MQCVLSQKSMCELAGSWSCSAMVNMPQSWHRVKINGSLSSPNTAVSQGGETYYATTEDPSIFLHTESLLLIRPQRVGSRRRAQQPADHLKTRNQNVADVAGLMQCLPSQRLMSELAERISCFTIVDMPQLDLAFKLELTVLCRRPAQLDSQREM